MDTPKSCILKSKNLSISFADFIPYLRQIAAQAMEKQLVQCRRQISTLLANDTSQHVCIFLHVLFTIES